MEESPIVHSQNILYGTLDKIPLYLDVYAPASPPKEPMKVAVYFHGGGWFAGDKAGYGGTTWVPFFAAHGYISVSVNYRLSGTSIFPAQIVDCQLAIRWLRAHATTYHLDPNRIAVWGHSAGGHLALLATTAGDFQFGHESDELNEFPSRVQAAVSVAGPTDLLQMGGWHNAPDSPEARLLGGPIHDRADLAKLANPITYLSANTPPILLIHGDRDETVPVNQSLLFYEQLVNGSIYRVKDMDHGLNSNQVSEADLLRIILTFFDRHF